MDFYTLASTRRSIRKYTEEAVPTSDVLECIKTAVTAPSGCNSQCWRFFVIQKKETIDAMASAVEHKLVAVLGDLGLSDDRSYVDGKIKMATFFKKAPVCVAVHMTKLDYYDQKLAEGFIGTGQTHDSFMNALSSPDVLSIGAVIQNLLLALHEKGYGACWMVDPLLARDEISMILGTSRNERLMSLIPIGRSAYTPKNKTYKTLSDLVTVVE